MLDCSLAHWQSGLPWQQANESLEAAVLRLKNSFVHRRRNRSSLRLGHSNSNGAGHDCCGEEEDCNDETHLCGLGYCMSVSLLQQGLIKYV